MFLSSLLWDQVFYSLTGLVPWARVHRDPLVTLKNRLGGVCYANVVLFQNLISLKMLKWAAKLSVTSVQKDWAAHKVACFHQRMANVSGASIRPSSTTLAGVGWGQEPQLPSYNNTTTQDKTKNHSHLHLHSRSVRRWEVTYSPNGEAQSRWQMHNPDWKAPVPKDSNKGFMSSVSSVGGSPGVHSENAHIGSPSIKKVAEQNMTQTRTWWMEAAAWGGMADETCPLGCACEAAEVKISARFIWTVLEMS